MDLNDEIKEAQKSSPFFRRASPILIGAAAILSLILKFHSDIRILVWGILIVLALLFAINGLLRKQKTFSDIFAWMLLGVVILIIISIFFGWPIDNRNWIQDVSVHVKVQNHQEENINNILLRGKGKIIMGRNNKKPLAADIGKDGIAYFDDDIKHGDKVKLNIDFSEPYKSIYPDSQYILKENELIYLPTKIEGSDKVNGIVIYKESPLKDVIVSIDTLDDITSKDGEFNIYIPKPFRKLTYDVRFYKDGFITETTPSTPGKFIKWKMEKSN